MTQLAFGMDVVGCIGHHEAARRTLAGREERDTALAFEASSADYRILALLSEASAGGDVARLDPTTCTSSDDLERHLALGGFDAVVVDTSLADGWPVDVAADLINRIDRPFALLLLFEQNNDRLVAESRINAEDVWCFTKTALKSGELATIIASLARLQQARARRLTKN